MSQSCKLAAVLMSLCVAFLSTGCSSGNKTRLRLLNAATFEASIDMLVDGKNVASAGYGSATGYVSVTSGSRHLQIETSGTTNILFDETITITSGTDSTILVTNSGTTELSDNNATPVSGDVSIRAINASPTIGTADVYIVAPNTDISTVDPTASGVGFSSTASYDTVAAGSYQVIFTQAGSKSPVISSSPLSFSAGQVRSVVGLDGQNGGFTTAVLSDLN